MINGDLRKSSYQVYIYLTTVWPIHNELCNNLVDFVTPKYGWKYETIIHDDVLWKIWDYTQTCNFTNLKSSSSFIIFIKKQTNKL